MESETLAAYDKDAATYAQDWVTQPAPNDLYALLSRFFVPGGRTADIGSGSGREVSWLNLNGFPAVGYDASEGLLTIARRWFPKYDFRFAALPALDGIAANSFDNVLCETVIMHLPREAIAPSMRRLLDIAKPDGVLYLSWRVTRDADQRDKNGRLYSAFDVALARDALGGCAILHDEESVSVSSGKVIHVIVARKS
ncbi:MAG: class I SAM-dependent methyltransferase [Pseudolabrys sp.]|nr:class I SAM-dependent methyltransferase [Pseudolabrys sp.]MBV9261588.1 class I SAM-dependent methyltransferase [Pseudolabrys sp.]